MKLTNRTIPQAKNYLCDKCKTICCHANMFDDNLCYDCWDDSKKATKEKFEVTECSE